MFATPYTTSRNKVASIPAPVGGLNARDSIVAMEPQDAIVMRNWWPQPYGCSVRKGYYKWSEGMTGTVHSLAGLNNVNGTTKLFAWAGTNFYDCTTQGAVGAAVFSGLTDTPWQSIQLVNAAGAHMIAVNGADNAIKANGASVVRITPGDGIVANTWAGLSPVDAVQVTVHQSRLWAVQKNTSAGWYLPPDAVQGTFVKFDFGPLFPHGGYLLFLTTWTMDDGNGAEDHLVAFSSEGDAVVFAGTDPSDDLKWSMVGVYYMGTPVAGRRSFAKVGGDLIILTQQGAASMTETLVSTKVQERSSILRTDKIQFLVAELTTAYGDEFGWQLSYFAELNMLMINVPSPLADGNLQLVSNQLINAWSQFIGMDAAAWITYENTPFFSDYAGNVWGAWTGTVDGVSLLGTGGTGISAEVQQAYSYLGSAATQKQMGMYKPNLIVDFDVNFRSNIVYDFAESVLVAPDSTPPLGTPLWDVSFWNGAFWGGGTQVQRPWIQAQGMGNAVSIQLVVKSSGEVLWVSTDFSYVTGFGIL